jgi:hypothetical protein
MKELEKLKAENKELSNGKSSKECTPDEIYKVYRQTVSKSETPEERIKRINAFRCGW